MRARVLAVATSTVLLSLPARAQNCGPQTVWVHSTNVSSCGGPLLVAAPAPATTGWCSVRFFVVGPGTVASAPFPGSGIGMPAFLVFGTSNPGFDLTSFGYVACTLGASLDVCVNLTSAGGNVLTATIPVPADASLIGAAAYAQAVVTYTSILAFTEAFSNGLRIEFS